VPEIRILRAETSDANATQALAAAVADVLGDGDLIVLTGDLGAGKTCFTQGLGRALSIDEAITSPTFVLLAVYEGRLRLNHLDVYRLDDPTDVLDLDLPELAERGVTVIEWGEKIAPALGADRLTIELQYPALADAAEGPTGAAAEGLHRRQLQLTLAGSTWIERGDTVATALEPWLVPG